jgi:hypothetical protein
MTSEQLEDQYIRSFDVPLTAREKEALAEALRANPQIARDLSYFKSIREKTRRKEPATFGPYFARKVMDKIQNIGVQIDRQILAFFKKYQLAAIGVVVALLALNAVLADDMTFQSLFGLEETTPPDEEIISFDFSTILNNDL